MPKFIIAAVALLAAAGGLAYWAYGPGDDSAEAGVEVVRWGNITVQVTEGSGVNAVQGFAPAEIKPPDGGQVLILVKGESRLAIDADTGQVIQDTTEDADRAVIDAVLATLAVKEIDEKTAPWPYGSTLPSTPRERWGNITFIPPAPGSGLTVYFEIGDSADGGGSAIQVTNGRSSVGIDADTGDVFPETPSILPEDKEAIDRFLSTSQYAGPGE